jgi:hypothetical protein
MYYLGKVACLNGHRGFESPSLRNENKRRQTALASFVFVEKEVDEKAGRNAEPAGEALRRGSANS